MKHAIAAAMIVCGAVSAHAGPAPLTNQTVSVGVPKSELLKTAPRAASDTVSRLEVQASTWQPSSLGFASRVARSSRFSAVVPQLGVTYIRELGFARGQWGNLNFRTGLDYMAMSRSGAVLYGTASRDESQSLQWIAHRTGVEAEPSLLQFRGVTPRLSAALVSAFAVSARSALSDSESAFGMGYELGAGMSVDLFRDAELSVDVSERLGKSEKIGFSGAGVQAGLRFAI